jgi:hypothetical protein
MIKGIDPRSPSISTGLHDPFGFLITGKNMLIAVKVKIESLEISLPINFTLADWDLQKAEILNVYKEFQMFPFFTSNVNLKELYLSLAGPGTTNYISLAQNFHDIFKYKSETTIHYSNTDCKRILPSIELDEIKRIHINLQSRLNQISKEWTAEEITNDLSKSGALYQFVDTFNEQMGQLDQITKNMVTILEHLSNGILPDHVLGLNKTCDPPNDPDQVLATEGENLQINMCYKHKLGFSCVAKITQPILLSSVTQMHPVNYNGLTLAGSHKDHQFVRKVDTQELYMTSCSFTESPHPICELEEIELECSKALKTESVTDVIRHCPFKSVIEDEEDFIFLPEGGIFIQPSGSEMKISSGNMAITNLPPIIVYSPVNLLISKEHEEVIIVPEKRLTILSIIESKLTAEELKELVTQQNWKAYIETLDLEDAMNFSLAGLQIFIIPMAIISLICAWKQGKNISTLQGALKNPLRLNLYNRRNIYRGNKERLLKDKN